MFLKTMSLEATPEHGIEKNSQKSHTMSLLSGYEDLGVSVLKDNHVAKRCRYLNPNSTIWPMGYGLITSLYKYRHKKPVVLNNYFDNLPEELVLYIFTLLDKRTLTKCAYVCKQWRRIAYDESLWYCLNIPCRRMSVLVLDNLLKRNIKFLSISHANVYIDSAEICNIFFETPLTKLLYLDLSAVFIPVQILNSLLSQCSNLVKLSIENCQLDQICCRHIANNTKLRVLNLASTNGLNVNGLKHILSLENLEEFNVSWANMKVNDLHYLATNMMSSLKCLNISGFLKKLTDSDLISLVYRCPQLIELDISDNLAITSESLDFILHNQHNLKVLSMSRCYEGYAFLQPNTLRMKLDSNNHRLKELNVFGMPNQQLFNSLCAYLLEFDINKSMFSCVARPKPNNNEHAIWEIPVDIDC